MSTRRIDELVSSGDWACAYGEPASLRQVCWELARTCAPAMAQRARLIAKLAHGDMWRAVEEWDELAADLRSMRGRRAPSPVTRSRN